MANKLVRRKTNTTSRVWIDDPVYRSSSTNYGSGSGGISVGGLWDEILGSDGGASFFGNNDLGHLGTLRLEEYDAETQAALRELMEFLAGTFRSERYHFSPGSSAIDRWLTNQNFQDLSMYQGTDQTGRDIYEEYYGFFDYSLYEGTDQTGRDVYNEYYGDGDGEGGSDHFEWIDENGDTNRLWVYLVNNNGDTREVFIHTVGEPDKEGSYSIPPTIGSRPVDLNDYTFQDQNGNIIPLP